MNKKKLYLSAAVLAAVLQVLFFPQQAASQGTLDEKIITFRTKDGVQIIGSLYLPYEMIRSSCVTPYDMACRRSIWYQTEIEMLASRKAPERPAARTVSEAGVSYERTRETADLLKSSCFNRAGKAEFDPYDVIFQFDMWDRMLLKQYRHLSVSRRVRSRYVEAKKSEEEEYQFEEYLPRRTEMKKEEHRWQSFINKVLTVYGDIEKEFSLETAPLKKRGPEKKEQKKTAVQKPRQAVTADGFRLAVKKRSGLKDSCFDAIVHDQETKYPAVVLFHMWQRDRYEWRPLIPHLQEAGFVVLAIDLRGHGESLRKGTRKLVLDKFYTKDFSDMLLDAFGAYEFLCSRSFVDSNNISAVGASIGTMVSVRLCEKVAEGGMRKPLAAVVLMSPGKNFFGVYINDSLGNCTETPFLFVLDKQDPTATERDIFVSGSSLYKGFKGTKKAIIFDGVGHGTLMFNDKTTVPAIVEWLKIYSSLR